jgi:LEA14-like dessication related protein
MGEDSTDDGGTAKRVKTLLLGSIPRIVGTAALSLVLVAVVAVAAGVVGVPSVMDFQNEFSGVNESTTVIGSDIAVRNPNPIGAGFLGVSAEYDISMNDVRMANGSTGTISMPPGNSTIDLETHLDNDRIPAWWTSHVERDEQTTVAVNATVESDLLGQSAQVPKTRTIETDMLSSFNSTKTRPVNASSVLVDDPILYVNETAAQWGETSEARTGIVVDFYVYNPKQYAIPISKLNYTIDMNDVRVGAGENTDEKLLPPEELTRVRTVTYIQNEKLDEWWVSHVERDQVTDVVIDFDASLELSQATVQVPLEGMTHRETVETDVFGTKDDGDTKDSTNESDDGGADDGSTDDGTTTDDGSATDDGTSSSDGETTTDDGGIVPEVSRQGNALVGVARLLSV